MIPGRDGETREDKSRLALLIEANREPVFSPLLGADHLLDALTELGFATNNGFGQQPVSWWDLVAYAQATGAMEDPWEFRAVARMSRAYLEGVAIGEKIAGQLPWHEDD